MIKMQVIGIALDTRTGSPIVILNDVENRRTLPIWIGSAEASAIIRQMENIKPTRPMTHDFIKNLIETLGYTVDKIEINDMDEETYFATITLLSSDGTEYHIDARPSDAIAIALRINADIFVTDKVILDGTIPTDYEKDEAEAEEFKEFIKDLKPSDFQKLLNDETNSDQ